MSERKAPAIISRDRRCAVCSKELVWPCVEFCSAACSEEWVRRHREAAPGWEGKR